MVLSESRAAPGTVMERKGREEGAGQMEGSMEGRKERKQADSQPPSSDR